MKKAIILFVCSLLSATVLANNPPRYVHADENQSTITKALNTSFGPALEAVTAFNPFYLTGDFNGDGMPDLLVVVRIKLKRDDLPKDVRILNPFYNDSSYGPAYPTDPAVKTRRGFAIIHGTKAGWNGPTPLAKFLLVGESPIRLMFMDAGSEPSDKGDPLMELIKRGSKRSREYRRASLQKGDLISLPTGGAGSFLYWDGRKYRWQEYGAD